MPFRLSATSTVKSNVPLAASVPESRPLAAKVRLGGKLAEPDASDQL